MKNKIWIILAIIFIICICIGVYIFKKNTNKNQEKYVSTKTSINQESITENNSTENNINETDTIHITQNSTGIEQTSEEEISSFSTKIFTKESSRQNNITLTCTSLNGTIIPNGSTFSFCDTLGPSTYNQGYQKADVFDDNGNKIQGLGGGKCQVSTTLYNAVLKVPSLPIVERHPHSNKVPYIESGKDAAVSYGSYDLKFRNDTGFDVKIKSENTSDNVIITLYKLIKS